MSTALCKQLYIKYQKDKQKPAKNGTNKQSFSAVFVYTCEIFCSLHRDNLSVGGRPTIKQHHSLRKVLGKAFLISPVIISQRKKNFRGETICGPSNKHVLA